MWMHLQTYTKQTDVSFQTLARWFKKKRKEKKKNSVLWIVNFIFFQDMFACRLNQVLENRSFEKVCTVCYNCVCWKHGKGWWKVLLFFVALDTHPLSVPDLTRSQWGGHSAFSAAESVSFHRHPALELSWELWDKVKGKVTRVRPGWGRHCLAQHSAGLSCLKRRV